MLEKLRDWNPWWEEKRVPEELLGTERRVAEDLFRLTKTRDMAKAIIGPRRAGKTTVMYQLISRLLSEGVSPESIMYVNLEDPGFSEASLEELHHAFLRVSKSKKRYLFLDEIQEKQGWESWVRKTVDQRKGDNAFVSGSTSSLLTGKASQKLAGRVIEKKVFPFSFAEVLKLHDLTLKDTQEKEMAIGLLEECLVYGCYPRVLLEKEEQLKQEILLAYYETIVSRDVAASHGLDLAKAKEVFVYLFRHAGDLTSVNKLRQYLRVSYETAEKYVSAMKDSMILLESRRYSHSLKEQLAFPRKFYPVDNGLRWVASKGPSPDKGKLLESFIAQELVKKGYELFYWGKERQCDFIIVESGEPVYALQVTYVLTNENREREERGLKEAMREFRVPGKILTLENTPEFLNLLGNGEKVFK